MNLDRTVVEGTQCQKFYLCALNRITILSCPTGLLFDQITKKCNYANLVVCSETITSTTKQGTINTGI
jgi:hypothetical protein